MTCQVLHRFPVPYSLEASSHSTHGHYHPSPKTRRAHCIVNSHMSLVEPSCLNFFELPVLWQVDRVMLSSANIDEDIETARGHQAPWSGAPALMASIQWPDWQSVPYLPNTVSWETVVCSPRCVVPVCVTYHLITRHHLRICN